MEEQTQTMLSNMKTLESLETATSRFVNNGLLGKRKVELFIAGELVSDAKGIRERSKILVAVLNTYLAENIAAHKEFGQRDYQELAMEIAHDTVENITDQMCGAAKLDFIREYAERTHSEYYAGRDAESEEGAA